MLPGRRALLLLLFALVARAGAEHLRAGGAVPPAALACGCLSVPSCAADDAAAPPLLIVYDAWNCNGHYYSANVSISS